MTTQEQLREQFKSSTVWSAILANGDMVVDPNELYTFMERFISQATKEAVEGLVKESKKCSYCDGDGWTTEHDTPDSHSQEDGSCISCPIQEQCDTCHGEGKYITLDTVRTTISKLIPQTLTVQEIRE